MEDGLLKTNKMTYFISISLFIFVFAFIFAKEILAVAICGWYIKDKNWVSIIVKEKNKNKTHLTEDNSVLLIGNLPFISSSISGILSKYYIYNTGRVWRWSKTHKIIEKTFNEMIKQPIEKL